MADWDAVATRRRLGVALVLDPPIGQEVDGLRRAVGDPSLGRIPPHLTLVPPVNVADLDAAIERLRAAAGGQAGPLQLTLGPPTTFLPSNPVLYLPVGGDLEELRLLRDSVFKPPLERKLSWPWVPHVTIADGIEEHRIGAAQVALDGYWALAVVERVVLLEERKGRVWTEIADAVLERRAKVGTGGLVVHITRGRLLDPLVLAMLGEEVRPPGPTERERPASTRSYFHPVVMTARREDQTVGVAIAYGRDNRFVFVRPDARRQGIGGHLRRHLDVAIRTLRTSTGPAS